jgi:hypothetical protein
LRGLHLVERGMTYRADDDAEHHAEQDNTENGVTSLGRQNLAEQIEHRSPRTPVAVRDI